MNLLDDDLYEHIGLISRRFSSTYIATSVTIIIYLDWEYEFYELIKIAHFNEKSSESTEFYRILPS